MACHNQIIIVGGGVAGLAVANRLADLGEKSVVIEKGTYPQQRICGEFLSYECLSELERWNIPISYYVKHCRFLKNGKSLTFSLPKKCGCMPRDELERCLYNRAVDHGVEFLLETSVTKWNSTSVRLSTGETLKAKSLIIGTGKLTGQKLNLKYFGYKTHITNYDVKDTLEMRLLNGGYLGLNRVGEGMTNVAILSNHPLNPWEVIHEKPVFDWLETRVPEFGLRHPPSLPDVFFVGDAMGSIPPASGDGLAIAITSGCMAAEFVINGNAENYHHAWRLRYQRRFYFAIGLHRYLLNAPLSGFVMAAFQRCPLLTKTLFQWTRK